MNKIDRINLGKSSYMKDDLPNLLGMQLDSYEFFLQREQLKKGEKALNQGLEEVLRSVFPIHSNNGTIILDCEYYTLDESSVRHSVRECKRQGLTYSINIKLCLNLFFSETGEIRQKQVYIGEIPLMTEQGTFIMNGVERVVVSQIHRSPGVIFFCEGGIYQSRIIPYKGGWLEFEIDPKKDICYVKIDKKKKIFVTTFLRALGMGSKLDILKKFYKTKTLELSSELNINDEKLYLMENLKKDEDSLFYSVGSKLTSHELMELIRLGVSHIEVIDFDVDGEEYINSTVILNTFMREELKLVGYERELSEEEAVEEIMHNIFGVNVFSSKNASEDFQNIFFSEKRYDLGRVGRYRLMQKFNIKEHDKRSLLPGDVICVVRYLIKTYVEELGGDDIDHLGNRRVRMVGELLENIFRSSFLKLEKIAKERMSIKEVHTLKPQDLISIKPISSMIREFFGISQLSQYMDQTNLLSSMVHKRRLNALGVGGLNRDRAGFEVRDVHYTHYGRMCPIETPEGQNIGLIVSLTTYARVNQYGFLETPYYRVVDGQITKQKDYLSALEEEHYYIAQASAKISDTGLLTEKLVPVRRSGDYLMREVKDVQYIDVSPRQIVSLSAALIPFLEHDDANRALMGSNMQRQSVPLLFAQSPIVGTGLERKIVEDSGVVWKADHPGKVSYVSYERIEITYEENGKEDVDVYPLSSYERTNQETWFNQKPIVIPGEQVVKNQILCDSSSTENGELALGANLLVAFIPWHGYNYEDAILVSERVVHEDIFTSVHIKEYSVDIRETKIGPERITKDIPNISDKMVHFLDEDGVIALGSYVRGGDILVGKITPKTETENTPEFKLLNSIFGEKVKDVKDSSLRVPHGVEGTVIDVQRLTRSEGENLSPGVEEVVKIFIAKNRKLKEGDKMAGRHGNKGVVSRILPISDMPYLADGTPIDICLNPLGIPSRMNIGQLLELGLGMLGYQRNEKYTVPVFDSISQEDVKKRFGENDKSVYDKVPLYDGLTGEQFDNDVSVGVLYMLKLHHLVDDKMHARSTGPYSLITQQPLGGKAQFGGQRLGEMEVWALEAYGAANTLQELLTVKSDDMQGRVAVYSNVVKGEYVENSGVPESFNVLIQELRGLGIDISVYNQEDRRIPLTERDEELILNNKQ